MAFWKTVESISFVPHHRGARTQEHRHEGRYISTYQPTRGDFLKKGTLQHRFIKLYILIYEIAFWHEKEDEVAQYHNCSNCSGDWTARTTCATLQLRDLMRRWKITRYADDVLMYNRDFLPPLSFLWLFWVFLFYFAALKNQTGV